VPDPLPSNDLTPDGTRSACPSPSLLLQPSLVPSFPSSSLQNGSSGPALKKDDLLNLGEVRKQLAAAEQRVAELEALLEESKKKDGLLGLVQKAHQTIRKDMGEADRAMNEMRTRWGIPFGFRLGMLRALYRVSNVWGWSGVVKTP
jgi:hypothetical protein